MPCTQVGGTRTDYLLGLRYAAGTEWVFSAEDPNDCSRTSNGAFTSLTNIGRQLALTYASFDWVPPQRATDPRSGPCDAPFAGRLGQQDALVPAGARAVKVCEATRRGSEPSYRTVLLRSGFTGLLRLVNDRSTHTSTNSANCIGGNDVSYTLDALYPKGPPVRVDITPSCRPGINNTSLQADDGRKVAAAAKRLLDNAHAAPGATGPGVYLPADAYQPAAGTCGRATGAEAVVQTNPDTPAPRCQRVRANQRLRVVNTSGRFGQPGNTETVTFTGWPARQLAPGQATVFDLPFGDYLAPGVHRLQLSLYAGGGSDVWLEP